jgi:hypothetical protein
MADAAKFYTEEKGWSVIPLVPGKKFPPKDFEVDPWRKKIATRDDLNDWAKEYPKHNLGLVCGKLSKVLAIDHDIYKPEYSEEEALKYIPDNIVTPTSETPKKGQHQLFTDPDNDMITIGTNIFPGGDWRCNGGQIAIPPSVNEKGVPYIWLIPPTEKTATAPDALLNALINNINNKYRGESNSTNADPIFKPGQRDENLFHIASSLAKTGNSEDYIKQVLTAIMLSWGEADATWVNTKVQSALQRAKRQDRTLSADVREYVSSTQGVFMSTDVYSSLQLSTRDDKKNVSIILKRMCDDAELERYGNKNGQFRRIDNEISPIDWKTADTAPLNLQWPFGVHNLVHLYPGNIGIIAGYPNAGKTAFIHNFIRLNQQHDVHLFSSEGGREELKMRLSKFDYPVDDWKFSYYERSGDFADVIKPDAINIIDYLEIHDDFYKVGGMIKAISDKLKNGFALIAIQKNNGRDEGLGGARGLEKPRLYMAMDSGRLKIVKAKSWVDSSDNPNGKSIRFKIVDGCKFIIESRWERSE